MNELMKSEIKMTSLDLAELTGKRHDNVMRDIKKEIEELGEGIGLLIFEGISYTDSQNRKKPCYEFGKEGAMQLALKYDAKIRYKVIKKIEELENKQSYKLPTSYKEALLQLVEQVDKNEKLEIENKMLEQRIDEYEPKITYLDTILNTKDTVAISQIAEDYGMSAKAMNIKLKELGIQYKINKQWLLYSKHKGKGFTKSDTYPITHKDGTQSVEMHTKWTQKGRLFIYESLKKINIYPLMDLEIDRNLRLVSGEK
ncbi:phage regulatory protein/antirepressor Ant [Acinetobacter baumannii]